MKAIPPSTDAIRAARRRGIGVPVFWVLIGVAAGIYAIATAASFSSRRTILFRTGDGSADIVIAHSLAQQIPGPIYLPLHRNIIVLAVDAIAQGITQSRFIPLLLAPLLTAVTIALIAWCLFRLTPRRPAAIGSLLLIASPLFVFDQETYSGSHVTTWLCEAIAAAYLVAIVRHKITGRRAAFLTLVLGFCVGMALVSDLLTIPTVLLPLLTAFAAAWLAHRSRLTALHYSLTLEFVLSLAATFVVASLLMNKAGVTVLPSGKTFSVGALSDNTSWFFAGLLWMGGAWEDHRGALLTTGPTIWIALPFAIALVAIPYWAARTRLRVWRATPLPIVLVAFVTFWVASDAFLALSFVLSNEGGAFSARYLIGYFFSAGALLPILLINANQRRILAAASVAAVFALFSAVGLVLTDSDDTRTYLAWVDPSTLATTLSAQHLQYGYTEYDLANAITWASDFKVLTRPVFGPGGGCPNICPAEWASFGGWYRTNATRTFIAVPDKSQCLGPPQVSVFGRPASVVKSTSTTLYIYNYDVASRFGSVSQSVCA